MKEHEDSTTSETLKFLATLWVSQEILKLLPYNPPWKKLSQRVDLQQLSWKDEITLRAETAENSRLILGHSRLILSHIPARNPAKKAAPPKLTHGLLQKTKTKQSKIKINVIHRLSGFTRKRFKLSKSPNSMEKRKS